MTLNARKAESRTLVTQGPWLIAAACCLASPIGNAQSAGNAWYLGVGAGAAFLAPETIAGIDASADATPAGTFYLGRDLSTRIGVQLQLHALGEIDFDNDDGALPGETAIYSAADVALLYRVLDTRSASSEGGLSLYGRFGVGVLERDSDLELDQDDPLWLGLGAGVEWHLSHDLSLRAEGLFVDTDAAAGYVSLVGRFGRPAARRLPELPDSISAANSSPSPPAAAPADRSSDPASSQAAPAAEPSFTPTIDDRDGDGVANAADSCPRSPRGYPVTEIGCALLDGVLTGVRFVDGSGELLPGSAVQLDFLADLLLEYPEARIELHAHSDNRGSPRDQAVVTRARLRTVGTYLVNRGISATRLILRSFGGSRPLFDNNTVQGQMDNNRMEILEHTR